MSLVMLQCKKEAIDPVVCTGKTPTFTTDIKPIMDANCATSGCHSASKKASGYDLSSYSGTVTGASKSAFIGSIQHKSGYTAMPKGASRLSKEQADKIACWVQNGTPQ